MVPIVERTDPGSCPGFATVGQTVEQITGIQLGAVDHIELYSCFPAAVRVQASELGLDADRQLTLTGGMTFAGGPFNHFVFQALVKLVEVLRAEPASRGLITSVSGMVTKQAAAIWSAQPAAQGVGVDHFVDVSERAASVTPRTAVEPGYSGVAEVVTSTVICDREGPQRVAAVVETPSGGRLLATSDSDDALAAFDGVTRIGQRVEVYAVGSNSAHAELKVPG